MTPLLNDIVLVLMTTFNVVDTAFCATRDFDALQKKIYSHAESPLILQDFILIYGLERISLKTRGKYIKSTIYFKVRRISSFAASVF